MNGKSTHIRRIALTVVVATMLSSAGGAQAAAPAGQLQALVSANRIDFATVDPLYRETMKRDGKIGEVVAQLQAMSKDTRRPKRERAHALLVASNLQWHFGLRPAAQTSVEEGLKIDTTADLALQQARLLEAAGELEQSKRSYEKAYSLITDPKRKEEVRLRMTFVAVGQQNVDALVRLAQQRDRDFRNRAAVALAVLGKYNEATGLYQIHGEESARFSQHLRLAQWRLEAGDAPSAQQEAWKAAQSAALDRDRRYALSVLVEAHEADNSLENLLARFEKKGSLGADEQDIRIDLLRKLRRYDEAIRLFKESSRTDITPALRRQLLRMYSDAGRPAQMVAEYRKLIAADPDQPAWTEGLAQYLMEKGDRPAALQVWREFIDRGTQVGALMTGAAAMSGFGFDDLAMAATDKVIGIEPSAASDAMLFRFELHMRRGRTEAAEAVLADMNRTLPPDSVDRVDLADAYERIKKPAEALRVLEAFDKSRPGGLSTDQRMRVAWLYDSIGLRDTALRVWKSLWDGQVPEASRRLIEDRLVRLTAEAGTLGDLAVELETRLADGTASQKDSALLIRIYTDTRDSASAIEVIREYFRSSGKDAAADVEALREQATVYRKLDRSQAFKTITLKLLELDPQNKVDYLQSLVLNTLENGGKPTQEQKDELSRWLAQLRETGGAAATAEFEAGILVLAGQEEQAIASYRSALAANPEHSDNYLRLAALLKKKRRQAEAVAALQYLVETAQDDEAFIVGVDGILNMEPEDTWVLEWAQRRVLERLTARDDKLYLYELLGELAEGTNNTQMYLSALESSLAFADSRRSNVLRELISATAKKSPESSAGEKSDPERNLRYSRRLVSLGEELPPDAYTDMGKTFLGIGDVEHAYEAFNRAVDRTGEVSLVEQTGDLFRNDGFSREAAMQYEKALIANADNATVMRKLADIRVRQGNVQEAADLYLRALLGMLRALPREIEKVAQASPPAFTSTVSHEYRDNFVWLLNGFLYALPSGDVRLPAVEQAFDEILAESMRGVEGSSGKELVYYPRLNAFSRFMREASLHSGRCDLADTLDSRLLRYFGADQDLMTELVSQRRQWGLPASAARIAALAQGAAREKVASADSVQTGGGLKSVLPSRELAERALAARQYERAVELALYIEDQVFALSVYTQWAKSILQAEAVRDEQQNIGRVMAAARQRLDAAGYASLSRYVIDLARGRPQYQRKLLATGAGSFDRNVFGDGESESLLLGMEKAAGRQAMTEGELRDLINSPAGNDETFDVTYACTRLPAADLVELVERNIGGDVESSLRVAMVVPMMVAALAQPLSSQLSARLADAFKKGLQKQKNAANSPVLSNMSVVQPLTHGRVLKDLAPSNAALVEEIDDVLAASQPGIFTPGMLKIDALMATGREREALPMLIEAALSRFEVADDPAQRINIRMVAFRAARALRAGWTIDPDDLGALAVLAYLHGYAEILYPKYQTELLALAQAKEKELGLTPAVYALLSAIRNADPATTPEQALRWQESMAERYPDQERVLAVLARMYGPRGDTDRQIEILERLVALAPGNIEYRRDLFLVWRHLGNPVNALTTAKDRLGEFLQLMRDDSFEARVNGMRDVVSRMMGLSAVARPLRQIVALEQGGSIEEARMGLHSLWQQLPPPGAGPNEIRQMMTTSGDGVLKYDTVFSLDWRRPEPPRNDAQDAAGKETFFDTEIPVPRGPALEEMMQDERASDPYARTGKFLDTLVSYELSIEGFEAQVRTLRPQDVDQQYLMYSLLADAYQKHGRLQQALERYTAAVEAGNAGIKERVLWLELLCRLLPQAQMSTLLPLVEKTVGAADEVSGYEQILLARVYARAGEETRAAEIYSSAALVALTSRKERRAEHETLGGLYVDAARHMSAQGLDRLAAMLLQIAEPSHPAVAASGAYFDLVIWMLKRTPDVSALQTRFRALAQPAPAFEQWSQDTVIEAASLLARQHQYDEALTLVAMALKSRELSGEEPPVVSEYRSALGLEWSVPKDLSQAIPTNAPTTAAVVSQGALAFKLLLPASADAWPGAQEWTQRMATQLVDWIGKDAVKREQGLQLLALVTLRLHQMGAKNAVAAAVNDMTKLMAPYDTISERTATLMVAVMEHAKVPIDQAMLESLIVHRRLDVRLLSPIVQHVAATRGAADAMKLGELAVSYTLEPNLLQVMKTLAEKAGRPEQVQTYIELERKSAHALEVFATGRDRS